MKAKLLLCMMVLGMLGAMAQPPQSLKPQVLDDDFFLMSGPQHSDNIQPLKSESMYRLKPQIRKTVPAIAFWRIVSIKWSEMMAEAIFQSNGALHPLSPNV